MFCGYVIYTYHYRMNSNRIEIHLTDETVKGAQTDAEMQGRSRKQVLERLVTGYYDLMPHEQAQIDKIINNSST